MYIYYNVNLYLYKCYVMCMCEKYSLWNVEWCYCIWIVYVELLQQFSEWYWKKNYRCFGFEIVVSVLKKPGYYIYGWKTLI